MIRFLAQVKKVTVKNLVSLDKSTRIELDTSELVSGALEQIPADKNVTVTIEIE